MMKKNNIKEMRRICYPAHIRDADPIFVKIFVRKISIYVTFIFLKIGFSPNAVSLMSMVVSFIGCGFLLSKSPFINLFGICLLHFGYVLDCCDGEIARYNNSFSITGMFLDLYSHYLIVPLIFIAFSLNLYRSLGIMLYFIFGSVAGIISMGLARKVQSRVIEELIFNSSNKHSYFKYFDNFKEEFAKVSLNLTLKERTRNKIGKKIFDRLRKADMQIFRHHMFLNLFTILVIVAFFGDKYITAVIFLIVSAVMILRELVNIFIFVLTDNVKTSFILTLKKVYNDLSDHLEKGKIDKS